MAGGQQQHMLRSMHRMLMRKIENDKTGNDGRKRQRCGMGVNNHARLSFTSKADLVAVRAAQEAIEWTRVLYKKQNEGATGTSYRVAKHNWTRSRYYYTRVAVNGVNHHWLEEPAVPLLVGTGNRYES
jgi:hypothetical protein